MRRRPPTVTTRIRISDLRKLKDLAKKTGKSLTELQRELIRYYRRRR